MSDLLVNIIIGVVLVLALGLSVGLQIFRTQRAPLGRVVGILSNLNRNERFVENFSFNRSIGKLKSSAWRKNQNKIDFLPQELRESLAKCFEMVEEANARIESAMKYKSDSYMAGIDISKLKEPIVRNKDKLQEWVQANMNNPDYLPKKKSLFRW